MSVKWLFPAVVIIAGCYGVVHAQDENWKTLMRRADSLAEHHQAYDSAIGLARRAGEIATTLYGPADTSVAKTINAIGRYFAYSGRYEQAESTYAVALTMLRDIGAVDHSLAVFIYQGLGFVHISLGDYAEAESAYIHVIELQYRLTGGQSAGYAVSLSNLADLYSQLSRLGEADSLLDMALNTMRSSTENDEPQLAQTLISVGNTKRALGDFEAAVSAFVEALEILRRQPQPDQTAIAWGLADFASVYAESGDYVVAESLLQKSKQQLEASVGSQHPYFAKVLLNLGYISINLGDYINAEEYIRRSEGIFDSNYGSDFFLLADAWSTLGTVYASIGALDEADGLFRKAYQLRGKSLGFDSYEISYEINNLGDLEMQRGNLNRAESLFVHSLAVRENRMGVNHPSLALPLENLALVAIRQKKYDEAEQFIRRAIMVQNGTSGTENPVVARLLGLLASTLSQQGRQSEADSLFVVATARMRDSYGVNHPDLANCLEQQVNHLWSTNRIDTALRMAIEVFDMRHELFGNNAAFLSEAEALRFANFEKKSAAQSVSLHLTATATQRKLTKGEIARVVFSAKGNVIDEMARRQLFFQEQPDSQTAGALASYRRAKFKLAQLFVSATAEDLHGSNRNTMDSLAAIIRTFESMLGRTAALNSKQRMFSVWDLSKRIPSNTLVLEYFRFTDERLKTGDRYCLLLLDGSGELSVIDLGSAKPIDSLIALYRRHFLAIASQQRMPNVEDQSAYRVTSASLYRLILAAAAERIEAHQNLIIAPDGPLNLVSFAGISNNSGEYLVERHTIRYISAARDLMRSSLKFSSGTGILAVGDPAFNADQTLKPTGMRPETSRTAGTDTKSVPGFPKCVDFNKLVAQPLPATRKELSMIRKAWRSDENGDYEELLGEQAKEQSFVAKAPSKRILHIATHGYFLPSMCRSSLMPGMGGVSLENPLLYSGLLFAGCLYHPDSGSSRLDDGIMSALEVSALDLNGTDLVVLSACETGLGDIWLGEGVYGLRRAFQMAGARMVVSSLWSIPDVTTAAMIGTIYNDQERPLSERLAKAQRNLLTKLRDAGFSDHPYSWAAFIVEGQQ